MSRQRRKGRGLLVRYLALPVYVRALWFLVFLIALNLALRLLDTA